MKAATCSAERQQPSPRECLRTPRTRERSSTTRPTELCGSSTRSAGTSPQPVTPTLQPSWSPTLEAIISHHLEGTRFGIGVDPDDGLLRQGAEGLALTWMDARIDGVPVTPRMGKAVEVNALWVSALATAGRMARNETWAALAADAKQSFARRFVRPDGRGLFDVVDGLTGDDTSVRPNQLLAVSLPDGPLGAEPAARGVVDACRAVLLTPLGLRSLAPDDPAYRAHHRGSVVERDAAYHEGTVWPWLIGPYVDAAVRVDVPTAGILDALEAHLTESGVGSISETADGAAPHTATGCPFQAWSVAEVLRVLGTDRVEPT